MPTIAALIPALVSLLIPLPMALAGQPLPTDERLVTGTLPSGVRYIVRQHDNPPDRASLWMHVSTGSLNETEDQRGIAHFLEHMAFNGSENFAPGEVVPFFESLGLTFGRHQNAFTSFDQTTYILALPDAEPGTLDKGLLFFSDVASALLLDPAEIEDERGVILEELRTGLGPERRVFDQILKRIAPGSLIGERLPIGVEETLESVDQDDFRAYYESWYVPSNITVMVVADMAPDLVVDRIAAKFGDLPAREVPEDQDASVRPYERHRAIVATDAELTYAEVAIVNIDQALPPVTTEARYQNALLDQIGTWVFNRRLDALVNAGEVTFNSGYAVSENLFNTMLLTQAVATGEPEDWQAMLRQLSEELQRARLHGFTEREIDDARAALISAAERAVEIDSTLPASAMLGAMNQRVSSDEPVLSAQQELDLLKRHLSDVKRAVVSDRFANRFDVERVTFILQIRSGEDVPTEEELLSLGAAAVNVEPNPLDEADRPTAFMSERPEAGSAVTISKHEASHVWSAWLANDVRLHYREMDYRKDQATIQIVLAAGSLLENAGNRGITEAATLAWSRPATRQLSSTNVRDLLTGKKVSVSGGSESDTMTLTVSGSPADLEAGMQLAHLLLTEPRIEEAGFEQWKTEQLQTIRRRAVDPLQAAREAFTDALLEADEPRLRPLEVEQVERLTVSAAQAWLNQAIRAAPIEVSVVGDIDKERAFDLVETYIGSLEPRGRISPEFLGFARTVRAPDDDVVGEREIETQTPMAVVVSGMMGPDAKEVRDVRLLDLAARILSTRMIKRIREEKQLVYSISVVQQPSEAVPGMGIVIAPSATDPARADELANEVLEMFGQFAEKGPSEEELEIAKKQVDNELDEQMREPGFWMGTMSPMTYRGRSLDDALDAPDAYQSYTTDEVRAAFGRYFNDRPSIRVIVRPKAKAEAGDG